MKNKKRKIEIKSKDEIIQYINQQYGEGYIFKLPSKDNKYNACDFISTGCLCLNDLITGDHRCGVPRRRMIEIFGPESSGKTTLALSVCKEVASNKGKILYVDIEHGLNEYYAAQLNIDREYFYFIQPKYGEQAFTMIEDLIKKFKFDLFVFDSVGGMSTRAQLEGNYDESNMGSQARLMSKAVGRLAPILADHNMGAIFINQLRSKIGGYGASEDTTGGKKLKFYLWSRIEIRAPRGNKIIEKISQKGNLDDVVEEKEKEEDNKDMKGKIEVGVIINVKTVKNKLYIPFKKCNMKILYGKGIDKDYDLLSFLDSKDIISLSSKSKLSYRNKNYLIKKFLKEYNEGKKIKKEIDEKISLL